MDRKPSRMEAIRAKVQRSGSRRDPPKNNPRQNHQDKQPSSASSFAGNLLIKWFREIRSGYFTSGSSSAHPEIPPKIINRSDPFYASEGKSKCHQTKKKKSKDHSSTRRRHSFIERQVTPQPIRRRTRTNGFEGKPRIPAKNLPLAYTMMPSRSTPNLQQSSPREKNQSIYSYLQPSSTANAPVGKAPPPPRDESPPPAPPVRDSSSLKSIKYGPGHEKFPSWPVPAAAEAPQALRGPPSGGSHRSKSWTDHTNYPKEKVVTYTRPHMKRQHSSYTQQKLKTVMEKCEKIPPETFESRYDKMNERVYLSHVDRDGKQLGDMDYMVPSPPERDDVTTKPQLTQADLEEYARSYQDPVKSPYHHHHHNPHHLTKSGLEEFMEYTRSNYDDSLFSSMGSKHEEGILTHLHQKQLSYAQSEGYHSYVSSTDSTSTPFLDRLRRDSEAVPSSRSQSSTWDDLSEADGSAIIRREGRDSVVTTSSGSVSSSETLKWHGSMSDVSVASSSCTHLANSSSSSVSRQLIAHSARVQTPQRHHSESVLYMSGENQDAWKDKESRNNSANKLKLFPVNTYTVLENDQLNTSTNSTTSNSSRMSVPMQSVADRISELERQQRYSYLDPEKRHKVPDPTLKAIQKKALLSYYERQHNPNKTSWRSEPQLAHSQQMSVAPQPPPRVKVQLPSRRASSASDYASGANSKRSSLASNRESKTTDNLNKTLPIKHQHSNSCGSLSSDLLGPVIVGHAISVDDWVPEKPPERPPKNPHLRTAFPDLFTEARVPSPDLPPPSPPTVLEDEVFNNDDPLPPPPPECETTNWQSEEYNDRLKESSSTSNQFPAPQVQQKSPKSESPIKQTVGLPEGRYASVRSSIKTRPGGHIIHQVSSKPYHGVAKFDGKPEQVLGFPGNQQAYAERSSARYPTPQKLTLNGCVAVSQKVLNGSDQYRAEPLRAPVNKTTDKSKEVPTINRGQRSSIAEVPTGKDAPPPLQPRQMRTNQSMRARIPHDSRPGAALVSRSSTQKEEKMRESRSQSMSQSKASSLTPRRDRDKIVPDSDIGIYKRTMSPNGHSPSEAEPIQTKITETLWQMTRSNKELIRSNNNNNTNLLRRSSMNNEKAKKIISHHNHNQEKDSDSNKKPNLVLPDVLPMNAKMLSTRSQFTNGPTNLSLSPLDGERRKTPPSSPTKTPPRGSPFAPLRSTSLSNPPALSAPVVMRTSSSPKSSSPVRTFKSSGTSASPPSPKRASPLIKPSLSPGSPVKLLSPLRSSPSVSSSSVGSSPLHTSPLSSPHSSPKPASSPDISPPNSPKIECPQVVEGLQLIQRTEVVLRVNTSTTDASSQTEKEELPPTPLPSRKKLQEEIECEKLSEDFVNHLPTSDRLKGILVPGPDYKKPTDYVHGLFKVDVTLRPRPANSPFRSRNNTPSSSPPPTITSTISNPSKLSSPMPSLSSLSDPSSPLSGTSTYFTISEPKAKFLTRFSQDMNQCHIVKDTKDLNQKKEELVSRLDRKLEVLRTEQLVVSEECRINNELGENVEAHIRRLARPHEADKFRLHIEEVGKITSLLLGLSGRLARAENALAGLPEDHPERRILESKRDKLLEQLEEAKKLKESIDRRGVSVSGILHAYLNGEEFTDYDHFINMRAKLIMDSKEIADKIKLGEEQLLALKETLIVAD